MQLGAHEAICPGVLVCVCVANVLSVASCVADPKVLFGGLGRSCSGDRYSKPPATALWAQAEPARVCWAHAARACARALAELEVVPRLGSNLLKEGCNPSL